jgi:phospholipid/cholesterol/gamma-HCH transport system substrate-binding protein
MIEQPLKITKLKVGLTVFVGLVIFFVLITLVGTDEFYFSKTYNMYMAIDNVSGLVKGAPVTLGGFKIGSVESIDLIPTGSKQNIRLKLRLQRSYQAQITTGSYAQVTGIGILGDKFVDISIGKPDEKSLPENTFIPVSSGSSLEDISKSLTPGINDFNKVLSNLRKITDSIADGKGTIGTLINSPSTIQQFSNVVVKISSVLNAIESDKGTFGSLLKDKELYTNLSEASQNLKTLSTDLKNGKGSLGKLLANDSLYNNVNCATKQVNRILAEVDNDSTVVNGVLRDKKLYSDFNKMLKDLNVLINDLKEHPDKYVKLSIF